MASSQSLSSLPKFMQEDDFSQECKDLISRLPPAEPWSTLKLHQYKGYWLFSRTIQGFLSSKTYFQIHDSDIFLVTMPKSGTTWIKALTFALVHRKLYSDKSRHPLLTKNPHDLVPFLEYLYSWPDVAKTTSFSSPRIFGSHLSFDILAESMGDSNCKIVYLCRNPKDMLISLWQFTNKVAPQNGEPLKLEDFFESFCRGAIPYGPTWDQLLGYWRQSLERPDKVMFVKYEDMKQEPDVHVKRLAQFLGYPFSLEEESQGVVDTILELCSFDNLRNLDVNKEGKLSTLDTENQLFFRKGIVGDWKNYFTSDMIEKMDNILEQKFHSSGLRF